MNKDLPSTVKEYDILDEIDKRVFMLEENYRVLFRMFTTLHDMIKNNNA